jgi:hypothetical protein
MANYEPYARSNYFAVKDRAAFAAFCDRWNLHLVEKSTQEDPASVMVGFLCDDEQGFPNELQDDTGIAHDVDFMSELAEYLTDDAVAIVMEIGHEKLRYLVGYAVAVNAQGHTVSINLDEIYDRAAVIGGPITPCEY